MRTSTALLGLVATLGTHVRAACQSALKIDDFSKYSSNTNSLGEYTSDDGTMSSISAAQGVLSFKPKADSYFYESFPCQAASSSGYNSVQFTIKGPAKGSVQLELQTKTSCSTDKYSSTYYTVTGLTGSTQTITVPFTSFGGANANAISTISWSAFSSTTVTWQLGKVEFGCASSTGASTPVSTPFKSPSPSPSPGASSPPPSVAPGSSVARSTSQTPSTLVTVSSNPSGTCSPLLVDDWISQSRLTFLFYNALDYPSSDDGSAQSLTVGKPKANRLEIVPKAGGGTYFYTQLPCLNAKNTYGGISLRIKAPKGTSLSVELDSSDSCNPTGAKTETKTSADLGWTFDGTEKLYLIPLSKYTTIDTQKLVTILFSGFTTTVDFGPIAFYCGSTGEYLPTPPPSDTPSTSTVPAPANPSAANLVVDKFANANTNALGFYHGADDGMVVKYAGGKVTITANDSDYSYYSQISASCSDFSKYKGSYVHIAYSGSPKFTVALQQHNSGCNANVSPYPETWDSAEASRYAKNGHIWIPMSHFKIDFTRAIGFAIKGFYTTEPVTLSLIEIAPSVTDGVSVPSKDETGSMVFACKRPNSFAFAIDDGSPEYAQQVLQIIREENIKVTFFTVGAPLLDQSTNLTNVYKEMQAAGHQLAIHSYTHPKMEGLPDYAAIDWEYENDVKAMKSQFNGFTTSYFRPPFGTEGARMRSRLTKAVGNDATITMWSVDVEDWLWAQTSTPEQQKVSFQRDVNKGGNLVVMHYLYPTTVSYLRDFIKIAKATGKQLMRVDQCMMDPNAPPL